MRSTNPRDVAYMIRGFTRELHAKLVPADPSFLAISITCGKVSATLSFLSQTHTLG